MKKKREVAQVGENLPAVQRYALYCAINFKHLLYSTRLLFNRKSYGAALALGICAQEEFSKFFISFAIMMKKVSDEEFANIARNHSSKQVLFSIFHLIADELGDYVDKEIPDDISETELVTVLPRFLNKLTELLADLETNQQTAIKSLRKVVHGKMERKRQRGLYTDISVRKGAIRLWCPAEVSREEVELELRKLNAVDRIALGDVVVPDGMPGRKDIERAQKQMDQIIAKLDLSTVLKPAR